MKMNSKQQGFSRNIYNTLLQSYRPFILKLFFVVILGFLGRLILMTNAQIIAKSLDHLKDVDAHSLQSLVIELLVLLSVSLAFTLIYRTSFSRLSSLAVSRLYDETTYRVSRFPMGFFDQTPVGKITTRFSSDYGNVFRLFGGPLAEFLSILFDLISIIIIMSLTNTYFLVSLSLAGVCFYFILKFNQKKLRILRRDLSALRAPSIAHFSETIQGSLTIRLNQKEDLFTNRFLKLNQLFIDCKKSVTRQILIFSIQLNTMSALLFLLHGSICLWLYRQNLIGTGQITVILGLTVLATNTLQMFFEWYSQFDEALIGVERMDEFLRSPIEDNSFLPYESDFDTSHPKKRSPYKPTQNRRFEKLEVHNLNFVYPNTDHFVLKDIHFKLENGQKLGIIGRTGAGKSSLVAALLRLYPIHSGTLLVNNQPITDIEDYRQQFAVISQDQFFIKGSLKENLDLFNSHTEKELLQVLKKVGLDLDLNTPLEEKGQNLSQGEKQLMSLARGFLQNAELFIFDEATANIDPQTEKIIEVALRETLHDKTQIRIAHRLTTVEDCDFILWLDQGTVKKWGPAKEVLEAFKNFS